MSTLAEQVVEQLKTDMDNVYDAGYQKGKSEGGGGESLDVSKFGIINEVTGTNIATCDYVNENEHNVEVKLSSDTVTDFSGVEVKRIGANFLPYPYYDGTVVENGKAKFVENGDGSITVKGASTNGNTYFWITGETIEESLYLPAGTYNFSDKGFVKGVNYSISKFIDDVKYEWLGSSFNTFTFEEPVRLRIVVSLPYTTTPDTDAVDTTLYPMLNVGSYPTDYEPPQKTTYTANADGTVDVTSISPTMNIICDTEGVNVSAKYYCCPTAEYDRFWDNYQEFGNRKDGIYMFYGSGWNDKNLKPKHKMKPTRLPYAFQQCGATDLTEVLSMFDTSESTNFGYMFDNSKVEIIPKFSVKSAPNLNAIFNYGTKIRKIECVEDVNKDQTLNNAFTVCNDLEEIYFTGEIGKNISFLYSNKLTDKSVQNIIDHLVDLTGQTSQTLAFPADVKAKLTEEQIASITAKNWTLA